MPDDAPSDPVTKILLRRRRELEEAIRALRDSGNPATEAAIVELEAEVLEVGRQADRNRGSAFALAYRDHMLTPRDQDPPPKPARGRRRRT